MKTISVTVSNRPHYLQQLINSLYLISDINDFTIVFGIEPGCDKSIEICKNSNFFNKIIYINKIKLGVRDNPYTLLETIFEFSELNIYLEEDIIVSPDIVYLSRFYKKIKNDHVLLNLFNKSGGIFSDVDVLSVKDTMINGKNYYFTPFAWISDKDDWKNYLRRWWYMDSRGWDFSVVMGLVQEDKRFLVSGKCRCNHIGEIGTHVTPEYNKLHFSNTIMSSNIYPIEYKVIDVCL